MSRAESYEALAILLEYPQDREALLLCCDGLESYLKARGLKSPAARFLDFLRGSSLERLQKEYVSHFDFNPGKAPYLGHHLYEDNQQKAAYKSMVKQEFARSCFSPSGNELPDHLTVLLFFLAHLSRQGEEECRQRFISEAVLPGLRKLLTAAEPSEQSPWLPVIETTEIILSADCNEVSA